jgi:hypothetical protein
LSGVFVSKISSVIKMPAINNVRKTAPTSTFVGGTANRMKFYNKDGDTTLNKRGWSLTRGLIEEFRDVQDWANGNRIRLIDNMQYASDATAAAAWVAADTEATTGVTVTRDTSDKLNGTSAVLFTVGSAFASATNVVKTLSGDYSNYDEDNFSHGKSYQNWLPYNYVILPYHAGQALAATDIDFIVTDKNSVTATYSLPEVDANHADIWQTHAIHFDDFTEETGFDWQNVSTITLQFNGATMGNGESITFDEIYLCKYCNGFTPAMGTLVPMVLGENNMAEGMQVKLAGNSVLPRVEIGSDGDEEVIGVLCGSGDEDDVALVQTTGVIVGELGSLTSLEVGDYVTGAASGGLTWKQSAGSGADAIGKYLTPFQDAAAQYALAWIQIGLGGAVPS